MSVEISVYGYFVVMLSNAIYTMLITLNSHYVSVSKGQKRSCMNSMFLVLNEVSSVHTPYPHQSVDNPT